jgi:regulation of enolase protein 1 (concanavalin A-like superfamily)
MNHPTAPATSIPRNLKRVLCLSGFLLAAAATLPAEEVWQSSDIGSVGISGTSSYNQTSDEFTVKGSGANIWGQADAFHYVYRQFTGGFVLVVKADSVAAVNEWSKAGLMVRESLAADSKNALMALTSANGAVFQRRVIAAGMTSKDVRQELVAPSWLKLTRRGNVISGYASADGAAWHLVGEELVQMPETVWVGLAVGSLVNNQLAEAKFSNLQINSETAAGMLPVPWNNRDIGYCPVSGMAGYDNGTYQLNGGGTEIWGGQDNFHYVYQPLLGNGKIVARVDELTRVSDATKGGLMIRESLNANAREAMTAISPLKKLFMLRRVNTGGASTASSVQGNANTTYWLQLERKGHVFTGGYSTDGQNWQTLGSETIQMPENVYIGLALTSNKGNELAQLKLSQVTVTQSGPERVYPEPWLANDIGSVGAKGVDAYGDGVFTVKGSGADIAGTADGFRFVYQPFSGDGWILAKVAGMSSAGYTDSFAKAGVMIREGLESNGKYALLRATPGNTVRLQYRSETGGNTAGGTTFSIGMPRWLMLEKYGAWVHGYESADGSAWNYAGSVQLNATGEVYLGLAVSSHNNYALAAGTFEGVQVSVNGSPRGLLGEYFNGQDLTDLKGVRIDAGISFKWGLESPVGDLRQSDFSVRWSGQVRPRFSEIYKFHVHADDGAKLWVNGQLIIDGWNQSPGLESTGAIALQAGQKYDLVMEYRQAGGWAQAELKWSSASQALEIIPVANLYPATREGENPVPADTDWNGLNDEWELSHFGKIGVDPHADPDGDGFTNLEEYRLGTNPNLKDSDGDGISDGQAIAGSVLREIWSGIGATGGVDTLRKDSRFPKLPSLRDFLSATDAPVNQADHYGIRMRGFIVPPVSGAYRFMLSGDDQAEFWLSDGTSKFSKQLLAKVTAGTGYASWSEQPAQQSGIVNLAAGQRYYFEVLHKENTGNDHVSLGWEIPGQPAAIIDAPYLLSWAADANDTDDNDLADDWELRYFAALGSALYADLDADGLTNAEECKLGTNPLMADSDGDGVSDRDEICYGMNPTDAADGAALLPLAPWQAIDINTRRPGTAHRLGTTIAMTSNGAPSGQYHDSLRFVYQQFHGDFEMIVKLRFLTPDLPKAKAGLMVRSGLDDQAAKSVILASPAEGYLTMTRHADESKNAFSTQKPVNQPEFYWLKVKRRGAEIVLSRSANGAAWTELDRSVLNVNSGVYAGLTAYSEDVNRDVAVLFEQVLVWVDSDGDGILDQDEIAGGTEVLSSDSDADGFTDYEELYETFSNPVMADLQKQIVASVNGSQGTPISGNWQAEGMAIDCRTQNGRIEFAFEVPQDDLYRLEIYGRNLGRATDDMLFRMGAFIDGQRFGTAELSANREWTTACHLYTPWLKAGRHVLRLQLQNYEIFNKLRLEQVRLVRVTGPDENGNGMADWAERRLQALNTLDTSAVNLISPACLEGRAYVPDLVRVGGANAVPAPSGRWYANVELSADEPTAVEVDYESGGLKRAQSIQWAVTDVLASGDLTIRKGDALKLGAVAENATQITVKNSAGNVIKQQQIGGPGFVVHKFDSVGEYAVEANHADGQRAITVRVLAADLGEVPMVWIGRLRAWNLGGLNPAVGLEVDYRLSLEEMPDGNRKYYLGADRPEPRYVAVRAGDGGPILDSKPVPVIAVASNQRSGASIVETLAGNVHVWQTNIVVSEVYPDTRFGMQTLVSGVTFEDGTIAKSVYPEDFDDNGEFTIRFLQPDYSYSSVCHKLVLYHRNQKVGER